MKKIYKIVTLIVLIFIVSSPVVYAANKETMSKEEIMNKYYELKDQNQKLQDKYNELNQQWADKKSNVDDSVFKIVTIASAFFIVLTFTYSISIIEIRKHINEKVEKEAEHRIRNEMNKKVPEEVSKQVAKEKKWIQEVADTCKKEQKLKENKKILVISKESEDKKQIEDIMKIFKEVDYKTLKDTNKLENYDVVIINDVNGNITDNQISELMNNRNNRNNNKTVYLYFGSKFLNLKSIENTNCSKFKITLYNNLMALLNFQDDILLKDK